jgi:hypothetical protein
VITLLIELFKISIFLGLAGLAFVFGANLLSILIDVVANIAMGFINIFAKIFG